MRAAFLVLACLFMVSDPAAGSLDLPPVAPWGPPTAADTLTLRLMEARWNEDADASGEVRQEFWRRFPHHQFLLEEVARWHSMSGTSAALLNALATGTAEAFTGLSGLTDQDRLLLEGCALYHAGKLISAQTAFDRLLRASPSHSLARFYLYHIDLLRTAGGSPSGEAHARAALQDPEASQRLIGSWISAGPWDPSFDLREEARSFIEASPPLPVLQALLRGEGACDSLDSPGLSPDRFAELLDELHADSPAVCSAYLDDLVDLALVWLSPTSLREVLGARSDWLPPARFAEVSALLWRCEFLTFQAYAETDPSARTADARGLSAAADWHHDAAEVERWARQCAENDLARCWDEAEAILRERGHDAAADSVRAAARREAPNSYAQTRLWDLSWSDPSMSSALLDSLVSMSGERPWGWQLLMRSEAAGDHAYLEKCLESYGARWTIRNLGGAIAGAQRRGDGRRLEELAELVRRLAPGNTLHLDTLARASLGVGNHDLARAILTDLGEISPRPPSLTLLEVDLAVAVKDVERAKSIIEELLDSTDASPDELSAVVYHAGYYGWVELAERSMRMLESIASQDSRQVGLCRAELLRLRGELEGARQEISRWREAWPGSEMVRRLLVQTGGIVEEYAETSSNPAGTALAGLEFDYESTDWIQAGRSKPDEFPAQDMLILRDQVTYYIASMSQLVTRQRFTAELLSEAAVQQFQTLRIPFLSGGEVPRLLCARIVTPSGEAYDIPPEQMLISAHEGEEADVGEQRDLVIPLPGLKPGTVIDYCYQISAPPFLDSGHAWVVRFGNVYPQREEIVDIVVAHGIEHIVHKSHEPVAMERRELNGATHYIWHLRDQAATRLEEMAPLDAMLPHWIGCTTQGSWDGLARNYGRFFWPQVAETEPIRARATALTAAVEDDRDRAQSLFAHVQGEVDNIGVEIGLGRLVPASGQDVLERGWGDCKDKVAALISLAQAMDIACLPVLVGTRPSDPVEDDFPSSASFDHLIAYFPDLGEGVFSDPTLGVGCLDDLPPQVAGQRGLVIHPDGRGELQWIPELIPDAPSIAVEVDLFPEDGGRLRAESVAVVRNEAARGISAFTHSPDSTIARTIVDVVAGNLLSDTMILQKWEQADLECGSLEIKAVLRDSVWAGSDAHDASVIWMSSADQEIALPDEEDRLLPLETVSAQRYTLVLRAHESPGWRLSTRHSPMRSQAPGFSAEVSVDLHDEGNQRWLEIRREVELSSRVFQAEDFLELRDAYYAFRLAGFQAIEYHRQSDASRLEELRDYCLQNPEDVAFSIQAATQVLGGDLGGDGDEGMARRRLAREMLAPALAHRESGGMPYLVAATLATEEDRYLEADSLTRVGLERTPNDPYLLGYAVFLNEQLSRRENVIDYLRRMQSGIGGDTFSYLLIRHYLASNHDEDAQKEERRLHLIASEVDSTQLISAKIAGYLESGRYTFAREELESAEARLDQTQLQALRCEIAARERRWDDAIEAATFVQKQYPLHPDYNNNLAWYLACAGRDLERAEYLIRTAIALSDEASKGNTLGLVLLRQGDLKGAQEIFTDLMNDERPAHRVVNAYLSGLCLWMEGRSRDATERWESVKGLEDGEYSRVVQETLDAVSRGDDPTWILLSQENRAE